MRAPFITLLAFAAVVLPHAARADALDPEAAKDWVFQAGSLSTLRLLDEDAHLFEHPTGGMIMRIGSQVRPVTFTDGTDTLISRMNFTLGMGFRWAKLLIMADALRLSPDFFGHSASIEHANRTDVLLALPITINEHFALTPAFRYQSLERDDKGIEPDQPMRFLLRAKLGGLRVQAMQEESGVTLQSSFSPFEFVGVFSGELGESLMAAFGNPELLYQHYERGSMPYSLTPLNAPGEDNYGLRWELSDVVPRNLMSASLLARAGSGGVGWRRAEVSVHQVFKLLDFRLIGAMSSNNCFKQICNPLAAFSPLLAIGSPGATLLLLNASAFALNMDDTPRIGFTAGARLQFISNNKRLTRSARDRMSDYVLFYEGEEAERVSFYMEARVARNDFHSLRGLPLADDVTFGLWFGSEDLDFDPASPGIARSQRDALNEILDENPDFERDRARASRLGHLSRELRHPLPEAPSPDAAPKMDGGRKRMIQAPPGE